MAKVHYIDLNMFFSPYYRWSAEPYQDKVMAVAAAITKGHGMMHLRLDLAMLAEKLIARWLLYRKLQVVQIKIRNHIIVMSVDDRSTYEPFGLFL